MHSLCFIIALVLYKCIPPFLQALGMTYWIIWSENILNYLWNPVSYYESLNIFRGSFICWCSALASIEIEHD